MKDLISYLCDADERPRFLLAVHDLCHLVATEQFDVQTLDAYVRGQEAGENPDQDLDTSIIAGVQ